MAEALAAALLVEAGADRASAVRVAVRDWEAAKQAEWVADLAGVTQEAAVPVPGKVARDRGYCPPGGASW